ncbi:hypothetical protein HYDPIDRAFT_113616 [Hydnomerulius pinastri MD-312]|uniref:Uncharacterized protein n=1 Tax=Hydnomerulius pinastri MD-312 TaxID=994086 RepID=A0A0C9W7C6_9AGAM|nr:hypothetical protein HYDPIDRAFT_113616 [Hydnomerulius pinastri MD-312]
MSRSLPPTLTEVLEVAKVTARILNSCGIHCCLVGGAACAALGVRRVPNDVDMAVMTNEDEENIKQRLVLADSHFYLINPKTPGATYKVLWFRLFTMSSYRRSCKVDILRRGTLNIPDIPPDQIRIIRGLPIAPILAVLCLKLQAWDHHGAAIEWRFRAKQPTDARDIAELLAIAVTGGANVSKEAWLPQDFVSEAKRRVTDFLITERSTKGSWKQLGLYRRQIRYMKV